MFGGALAALASPAGLAAAGIGLVVGGLTKMVTKTLDVGRSLGDVAGGYREYLPRRGRFTSRAIEETNGDAGVFDNVVLRLSKSIGDASQGNKAAQEGFQCPGAVLGGLGGQIPRRSTEGRHRGCKRVFERH